MLAVIGIGIGLAIVGRIAVGIGDGIAAELAVRRHIMMRTCATATSSGSGSRVRRSSRSSWAVPRRPWRWHSRSPGHSTCRSTMSSDTCHHKEARMTAPTATEPGRRAPLPPRWFVRSAWAIHRAIYSLTRGRMGLRHDTPAQWGMMRLATTGRRSGRERHAILGHYEDGPNLVTMAMNGWGAPEPAWWLNLQVDPDATVELIDGPRAVRGRAVTPEERPRLWARWADYDGEAALQSWAARRPQQTAVVILEPRSEAPPVA
jgi:deazaflavin-dependent oxidoreductase (nitroreductase family)